MIIEGRVRNRIKKACTKKKSDISAPGFEQIKSKQDQGSQKRRKGYKPASSLPAGSLPQTLVLVSIHSWRLEHLNTKQELY